MGRVTLCSRDGCGSHGYCTSARRVAQVTVGSTSTPTTAPCPAVSLLPSAWPAAPPTPPARVFSSWLKVGGAFVELSASQAHVSVHLRGLTSTQSNGGSLPSTVSTRAATAAFPPSAPQSRP
eukprot:m.1605 g.1605  ORF g.1605 m.1605 type:complete len:122 (-) comp545_c0_seq1:120-485(-)